MPDVGNILRRILPGPKPEPIRWYDYGVRQQQRGNLEEAVRAYTEALRLDPEMAPAYSNRGSAYLNMGRPELAIADADEAISREPRQPVAYSVLGNAHHALGKAHQEREEQEQARDEYDQAARYLSQAIRINPRFAGFYSDRGAVHRAAGAAGGGDRRLQPGHTAGKAVPGTVQQPGRRLHRHRRPGPGHQGP